ncbi:MAG: hypothetical protein PF630_07700, partial [Gammaproteobacteria bacterium]|nr:hypothetical protein [Gammaproteobacteria bacterium]
SIAKSHNTADERFPARPAGVPLSRHCGVAILVKGLPFTAACAWYCSLRRTLNVTVLLAGTLEWLRFVLFEFRPNLALHLERSPAEA